MKDKLQYIQNIITRSFLEEITEKEREELNAWRKEDKAHEDFYQKVTRPENVQAHLRELADIDIEKAIVRNQHRLKKYTARRYISKSIPYAALVLLLVEIAIIWPKPETDIPANSGRTNHSTGNP